ncbi:MAG TPA: PQQ-binding-like beta-propeller repeat protein [Acetobacteraceae bacterium]|nr:PQQ-binding-like beta-propeller repeat protein [Acetobacteraceae bacterium]
MRRNSSPLLALALLVPALGAMLPAAAHARGLAFVVNSNDATVSLIDVETQRELRRVPMLREPHHMALTPDHKSLLIGDTTGNALFFLDPHTGAVQRRLAVSDPYQLVFSPDGTRLTVAGLARNQIDIYDAATYRLLHRIPARSMPSHINYSPDSRRVFVSLQGTDSLIAIDVASGQVLWETRVGTTPAGVLWHDGKLLVGIMGEAHIAVVDPADGHVERVIPTGEGMHTMFVPPDHSAIYATNRVGGTITVLDPRTLEVVRTLRVPGGADDIDFAPDGKLWTGLRWRQAVAVIDPRTGDYQIIRVGRSPHGIWLNTHDTLPETTASR